MTNGSHPKGRDSRGRFARGNAGGPGGDRRPCRREYADAVRRGLPPERVVRILEKLATEAEAGDVQAARAVLRALGPLPLAAGRLELPEDLGSLPGLLGAAEAVLRAVVAGELDEATAARASSLLEAMGKARERHDLEERIRKLEEADE